MIFTWPPKKILGYYFLLLLLLLLTIQINHRDEIQQMQ